jgi:hypothetical protein
MGNGFKYLHCNLTKAFGYLTIILIVGFNVVIKLSPHLNVWSFIHTLNFGVTFKNKFERGEWVFVLKEMLRLHKHLKCFKCFFPSYPLTYICNVIMHYYNS